jgi:hypothetical protein
VRNRGETIFRRTQRPSMPVKDGFNESYGPLKRDPFAQIGEEGMILGWVELDDSSRPWMGTRNTVRT